MADELDVLAGKVNAFAVRAGREFVAMRGELAEATGPAGQALAGGATVAPVCMAGSNDAVPEGAALVLRISEVEVTS